MGMDLPATRTFLAELIRRTQGNPDATISMYDVGAALGLEKPQAGKLAEEVLAEGWAEIKTLSGAIGVTAEGMIAAGATEGVAPNGEGICLGNGPLVLYDDCAGVEQVLGWIKETLNDLTLPYEALEEIVMDLKTAQVQLLSPRPKTAIVKEVLRSLQDGLHRAGATDTAARVQQFIDE